MDIKKMRESIIKNAPVDDSTYKEGNIGRKESIPEEEPRTLLFNGSHNLILGENPE